MISDETLRVIKAARLTNAEALARLAAAFDTGLETQRDWFWKHPLHHASRKPKTIHFLDNRRLVEFCAKKPTPFWSGIIDRSIKLIKEHFQDLHLAWASFALDEISPQSPGFKVDLDLGLKDSIVFHTRHEEPTRGFKYSITKPFLDERLSQLKANASLEKNGSNTSVEQRGIGLCVTKMKVSKLFGQLHFVHVDDDGKDFIADRGHGDERLDLLKPLAAKILKDSPSGHLWDSYVVGFTHLVDPRATIDCQLSATSLFHSLTDDQAHAAAQLVVGFATPPQRDEALLIYNCLQIMLSGLPALYSSMRRLRLEAAGLAKYKQMVQLLEPPLKRISGVLGQMQSDTQELRAVLYEPEEALFASYSLVEPYFRNGALVEFPRAGLPPIPAQHSADQYTPDEAQMVAAIVICAIFGKDKGPLEKTTRQDILDEAASILGEISVKPSSKDMAAELAWLIEQRSLAQLFTQDPDSVHGACCNALENIKAALFTPFKPDSPKWPQAALQLLHRHVTPKESVLTIRGENRSASEPFKTTLMPNPDRDFPCSYSTMLTFLRDFAVVARAAKATVTKLDFTAERGGRFVLTLSGNPDVDVKFLRKRCRQVMGLSRDWRIENANYGDSARAFVLFASRLMGIGSEWISSKKLLPPQIISLSRGRTQFGVAWLKDQRQLVIQSKSNAT